MTPKRAGTPCPHCRTGQVAAWDRDEAVYCLSCGYRPPSRALRDDDDVARRQQTEALMQQTGYSTRGGTR